MQISSGENLYRRCENRGGWNGSIIAPRITLPRRSLRRVKTPRVAPAAAPPPSFIVTRWRSVGNAASGGKKRLLLLKRFACMNNGSSGWRKRGSKNDGVLFHAKPLFTESLSNALSLADENRRGDGNYESGQPKTAK